MGREQTIIQQMKDLGIYDEAFLPSIKDLCTYERERSAMRKEWKNTAEPGKRPSFTHPIYEAIKSLNKDINKLRSDLGLVPAGLQRLRKNAAPSTSEATPTAGTPNKGFAALMDSIREASRG